MAQPTNHTKPTGSSNTSANSAMASPLSYTSPAEERRMMDMLSAPTAAPATPKKRNKLHAIWLRHVDKQEAKNRGTEQEQKARSLIFAAHSLHDEIEQQTIAARALLKRARDTPRPATPAEREALLQLRRSEGAGMEDYEGVCGRYNGVVAEYEGFRGHFRLLRERVGVFNGLVRGLRAGFVPAKRIGKVEYDIESLENAGRNLEGEVEGLGGLLCEGLGWVYDVLRSLHGAHGCCKSAGNSYFCTLCFILLYTMRILLWAPDTLRIVYSSAQSPSASVQNQGWHDFGMSGLCLACNR
ncbi:hypothetical protein LTR85_002329 [Meristemomyces frigidus]|nr:hypothetical protein LTR85_002329 [Meristemomyces frigidus]